MVGTQKKEQRNYYNEIALGSGIEGEGKILGEADFAAGVDSSETITFLLGVAFKTFSEIMAVAHAAGASQQNTVFQFDSQTSLTLQNVKLAQSSANNFDFV